MTDDEYYVDMHVELFQRGEETDMDIPRLVVDV